ncbi:MAG: hypothetical protein DU481_00820 [Nitrosomonas sp.]|uniref:hypothetical protein n=1 Tax=Nitrosomonas sp. TaxID=42353 RepID=UPI0032F05FBA
MSDEKEVAYYAAKVNAWFNTKLEYDKSLLVLSTGAIGLLITLLTVTNVGSTTLLYIFVLAIACFLLCIILILAIFSWNAKHLEELIAGNNKNNKILAILDRLSIFVFIVGVLLASIFSYIAAENKISSMEKYMSEKNESNQSISKESFYGANNLDPKIEKKSFDGAHNLMPQKKPDNNSTNSTGNSQSGQSTDSSKK